MAKKEREEKDGSREGGQTDAGGGGVAAVATSRKFEKALALRRPRWVARRAALPPSPPNRRGQPAACLQRPLPYRFLSAFAPHLVDSPGAMLLN